MSEYIRTKIQLKVVHPECLAAALALVRPQWAGHVEANAAGLTMYGWHGEAVAAQVVVRRKWAGGYGDLGFVKEADGTLTLIADDGHRGQDGVVTPDWIDRVRQAYAYKVAEKVAARAGLTLARDESQPRPDGSWRFLLVKKDAPLAGRAW